MPDHDQLIEQLITDGLLRQEAATLRTTRRWQGAMARAALRLLRSGEDGGDLRVPIASALLEIYGDELDEDVLVHAIAVILPVELRELG